MSILALTEELAEKVDSFFQSKQAHRYIAFLVIINAIVIGLEFVPSIQTNHKILLTVIDRFILTVFMIEFVARIVISGKKFFKNGWNIFDLSVTLISLLPAEYNLGPLRLLRVLHSLGVLEVFPKTRHIIDGLGHSMSGVFNVFMVAFVFFYVFSLSATGLFNTMAPDHFGSLPLSMYTLFKFIANPNWKLVESLRQINPYSFMFFMSFIICVSYVLVNLVVGVIVGAMARAEEENEASSTAKKGDDQPSLALVTRQLGSLQKDLLSLRNELLRK